MVDHIRCRYQLCLLRLRFERHQPWRFQNGPPVDRERHGDNERKKGLCWTLIPDRPADAYLVYFAFSHAMLPIGRLESVAH